PGEKHGQEQRSVPGPGTDCGIQESGERMNCEARKTERLIRVHMVAVAALFALTTLPLTAADKPGALSIDRQQKTVAILCKVAPRKLPNLNDKYPIEVIATWPAPKGQKAH